MDRAHGQSVARPAGAVRQLEHGVSAVPRLAAADVFRRIFEALSDEPDLEYAMVDATTVEVHRHGQGAKGALRVRPLAAPKAA